MTPYWLFFKTVVNTFISLLSAAVVLFTTGPAPERPRDQPRLLHASWQRPTTSMTAELQAPDPIARARAACQVKELGQEAAPLIPQLVAMLGDSAAVPGDVCGRWSGRSREGQFEDTTPGECAAAALVEIGTASVDALLRALGGSQWHTRRNAAWALGALDDPRAVEPLAARLKDSEPPVRRNAAWALGALDDGRAVQALVDALKDTDADTRAQAAWALGAIGDPRATEGLVRALREDSSPKVRSQAAWALGAIGDARASDALAAALKDPEPKVRRQAAWALGAIGK